MNVSTQSPAQLTEKQRAQFERDGYLCPIRVLDDREVERHLASYMEYSAANKARLDSLPPNQKYKVLSETHFMLPWVYEIVTHPRVLDAVETLLGPNLLAWNSNWFTKMPGEKSYVGWHQDGTYWKLTVSERGTVPFCSADHPQRMVPVVSMVPAAKVGQSPTVFSPPTVVTAWVALTPSTPANGCMRVIPGTHTEPMIPQRETYQPENALSRGQEIAVEVDEQQAVDMALGPGQMSLHHVWIIHGSNANTSPDTPRIGIAIRYTRPEVRQESPTRPFAMLVRGTDACGNFNLQPPPTSTSFQEQQRRHQTIVDHARASLMTDAKGK
jgi:non-haem Fe2+, alpha-ketoglutarate-dependent halogenase